MRRINPYANISLEPPPTLQANFGAPEMMQAAPLPQMEAPDTQGQVSGLGQSLMGLKQQFGAKQSGAIAEALKGAKGMLGGL